MPTAAVTDPALASSLRMSVMRLARRLRAERTDETLSVSQLATLATLDRHGPMTPGVLAAHEKVQPPSMTRILGALEQRGLVDRVPHETDGRQAVVAITRAGKTLLALDRRRRDAWLSRRLGELTAGELELLHAAAPVLERLAEQ